MTSRYTKYLFSAALAIFFLLTFSTSFSLANENVGEKSRERLTVPPTTDSSLDLSTVKTVDLSRFSDEQKRAFAAIASEEPCDCDCPKTLLACLREDTLCVRAKALAEYILKGIEYSEDPLAIKEAVRLDFRNTYCGPTLDIDISGSHFKGEASAPVAIVEISDFQCPFCASAHQLIDEVAKKYKGKVKVYFKHFPLKSHLYAELAAAAAEAAARQGKFWEMVDILFLNQDFLSEKVIFEMAKALELDMDKFREDINDPKVMEKALSDKKELTEKGIKSTPQIFINGMPFLLSRSADMLSSRIDDLLSKQKCCDIKEKEKATK
ncbi:MAG: hypothetical protein Kow0090_17920 [Myxococcota bacterium]